MSLYYEAAALLTNPDRAGGSFKSRIFGKKDLKSNPAQTYALIVEATKWSAVLKGVIERAGVLKEERKVYAFPTSILQSYLVRVHTYRPGTAYARPCPTLKP